MLIANWSSSTTVCETAVRGGRSGTSKQHQRLLVDRRKECKNESQHTDLKMALEMAKDKVSICICCWLMIDCVTIIQRFKNRNNIFKVKEARKDYQVEVNMRVEIREHYAQVFQLFRNFIFKTRAVRKKTRNTRRLCNRNDDMDKVSF